MNNKSLAVVSPKYTNKMKTIIVKDYLYPGNYILGVWEEDKYGEEYYLLDDGDMYTIKELKEEWGYKVIEVSSEDIIKKFKGRFEGVKK